MKVAIESINQIRCSPWPTFCTARTYRNDVHLPLEHTYTYSCHTYRYQVQWYLKLKLLKYSICGADLVGFYYKYRLNYQLVGITILNKMKIFCFALLASCLSSTYGYAPQHKGLTSKKSGNLFEKEKQVAAAAIASVFLASNVLAVAPAVAAVTDFGSSEIVSARSGGRMGGRSMGGSMGGRSMGRSYAAPRTSYSSTTIVRPMVAPPVVVSPFGGGFGYGYNPMGGFGLGYGLGALNSGGNAIRDYQQESEIQREKAELEVAKQKAEDLENRIKALESASTSQ